MHSAPALALIGGLLLADSLAGAADPPRLRAILWLPPSGQEVLVGRVRGQLSDVSVELLAIRAAPPANLAASRLFALGLARAHHAEAVVWVETSTEPNLEGYVALAQLATDSVLLRALPAATAAPLAQPDASSGSSEAAALVIRALLDELAHGAMLGVYRPNAGAELAAPTPVTTPSWRARGRLSLGVQASLDGQSPKGQDALSGRIGVVLRGLSMGLSMSSSVGADWVDSWATLRVARHAAAVWGDVPIARTERLVLEAGLAVGVLGYVRTTTNPQPTLVAYPSTTHITWCAGPETRGAIELFRGGPSLVLELGLDLVPSAPIMGYTQPDGFSGRHAPWQAQPRAGLGLQVDAL